MNKVSTFSRLLRPSLFLLLTTFALSITGELFAQHRVTEGNYGEYIDTITAEESFFTIGNVWLIVCAVLVFMMHLGFATLESGLTRAKNTINIIFKNLFVISSGLLLYALFGFRTMYPGSEFNGIMSLGFWIDVNPADYLDLMSAKYANYTWWTDFIFQAMFAATAATIVSGAVAERVKLGSFMVFTLLIVGFAYPVAGSWEWGTGWLDRNGFHDFAGSSVVHAFGGFAALACVLILGPRRGKYGTDGPKKPIIGHSMPLASVGVFLLWFGWFGFNGGSVLSAHPEMIGLVVTNTALAGAAGCLASMLMTQFVLKKPDVSMALNGVLAGLVGITAGADSMMPAPAILVGAIAGALVVLAILGFEKIKIDDPVGATSVHGVCGAWGTLAVGIFGEAPFLWQLIGTLSYALFAFVFSFVVFYLIKLVMGVRVTAEEEDIGLDISEHGQEAYSID
ncbi:ammonium transporter [Pelagicoccus sp. NFK12]|uniref:Ammonium transporter n=1 Tax=Pelagicoccus enzymogenes TaxID=2773457 RepID=A0A927IE76_9BACT|nr:ammonium transporter [Pelagicoccus enzymogenes]MBD5778737.1 ammonium transporter [Pelagicoccus enzymogenes]MDQ8197516.1 ammonium transporter [Pelagicoccus enzymogenes]